MPGGFVLLRLLRHELRVVGEELQRFVGVVDPERLAVLAALVVRTGLARGAIDHAREAELCQALSEVPARMADVLHHDDVIREISAKIAKAWTVLYLGRGADYPIALEGALKLKEISYIHAEGYAAGEMKHGPIALIDENMPAFSTVMLPTPRGLRDGIRPAEKAWKRCGQHPACHRGDSGG